MPTQDLKRPNENSFVGQYLSGTTLIVLRTSYLNVIKEINTLKVINERKVHIKEVPPIVNKEVMLTFFIFRAMFLRTTSSSPYLD